MSTSQNIILVFGAIVLLGSGCMSAPKTQSLSKEELLANYESGLKGLTVEIQNPGTVSLGSSFTFGAHITNTQDTNHTLRSIDIERTLLAGFDIVNIDRERTTEYTVDSINEDIYEFDTEIKPHESLDVAFTATATKVGEFGGDFDICIDNDINCFFKSISVIIQ